MKASSINLLLRFVCLLIVLALNVVLPMTVWAQTTLENPQPGSVQSGIGVISGWVCSATRVDIEIDGRITLQAAYGTARSDTVSICGKVNNGFGVSVNWNNLQNGPHTVRALKDGVEFARVSITVANLGLGDFPRGLRGAFTLQNFPQPGRSVRVQWQESLQNFVITNASGDSTGGGSGNAASALENPAPGSFQSGIGVISGWVCAATRVDIEIDGNITLQASYGTTRADTLTVCGDDGSNGFGLLVNWNGLPDGVHTVRALRDGVEFARATITVTTLGLGDFPRGLSGTFDLANFPRPGKTTQIRWQESLQNFVIVGVQDTPSGECANIAGVWDAEEEVEVTCTIDGETDSFSVVGVTEVTIKQDGCNFSWESEDFVELGIPPRTGVIKGNQLQGTGKFLLQVLDGPTFQFTSNSATIQGTINGNRIELTGSGSAKGKVCLDDDCVKFSCTGTSTGLFTR